jgi:dTDP-4-dehydrorhamnose 3,5-epimerase
MNIISTKIPDVFIIEPRIFGDERGFFFESYSERVFAEKTGISPHFVQDNHSLSLKNVLRGLHYQIQQPQGKLVRVIAGEVLDIAGFAHGFVVLSDQAEFLYKTTNYYAPQYDRTIRWNDPDLGIDWQLREEPILSAKDQAGCFFKEAEVFD